MKRDLDGALDGLFLRINGCFRRATERFRGRIEEAARRLHDPRRRISDLRMTIDDRWERLKNAFMSRQKIRRQTQAHAHVLLLHKNPLSRVREIRSVVDGVRSDMAWGLARRIERWKVRVAGDAAVLDTLSPLAVLKRGYSITRSLPEGVILRSVAAVSVGAAVDVRLGEGSFHARVTDIFEE